MRGPILKTALLVALWTAISAAAMLNTFLPVDLLAGLGHWWILRSRLQLGKASAALFALSFPVGQLPSFLMYMAAYGSGLGGFDGPPEWFVALSLAGGGLLAGLCQFLGLPKSWKNFFIWIPASSLGWAVAALGDLEIRGMVVLSALISGLVTGLAMLSLAERPHHEGRRAAREGSSGGGRGGVSRKAARAAGLAKGRR